MKKRKNRNRRFDITVRLRTYRRDGTHPDPGVVTHVEYTTKQLVLDVDEVRTLGLAEAIRRREIRRREALRRREQKAVRKHGRGV